MMMKGAVMDVAGDPRLGLFQQPHDDRHCYCCCCRPWTTRMYQIQSLALLRMTMLGNTCEYQVDVVVV